MSEHRTIGLWQTAFLGDAVLTLPLIIALKRRFPDADLHLYVRDGVQSLFENQPELTSVTGFAKRGREKGLGAAYRLGKRIGQQGFDLWISTHTSMRSALVAKSTGIRRRIGYDSPWFNGFAYTETVDRRFDELDEIERLMQLALPLGIADDAPWPELVLPDAAIDHAKTGFSAFDTPVLGIHPGSTWPTKCWLPEHFSAVAKTAAENGFTVLVFAGPGEETAQQMVIDGAGEKSARIRKAPKLNLPQLAAWIGNLDAYLTNDSGPMHLSWIQRTPTVACFGPTVRELGFFPRGDNATVLEIPMDCRPCGLHGHRKCPKEHHDCIRNITPDMAWNALRGHLGV